MDAGELEDLVLVFFDRTSKFPDVGRRETLVWKLGIGIAHHKVPIAIFKDPDGRGKAVLDAFVDTEKRCKFFTRFERVIIRRHYLPFQKLKK